MKSYLLYSYDIKGLRLDGDPPLCPLDPLHPFRDSGRFLGGLKPLGLVLAF